MNAEAVQEKEGKEEETSMSVVEKRKKPSKYLIKHSIGSSHHVEDGDYSAFSEDMEEGSWNGKEGTVESASKSSRLSRYLTLKGRSPKEEEEEEEGGSDGTGNGCP